MIQSIESFLESFINSGKTMDFSASYQLVQNLDHSSKNQPFQTALEIFLNSEKSLPLLQETSPYSPVYHMNDLISPLSPSLLPLESSINFGGDFSPLKAFDKKDIFLQDFSFDPLVRIFENNFGPLDTNFARPESDSGPVPLSLSGLSKTLKTLDTEVVSPFTTAKINGEVSSPVTVTVLLDNAIAGTLSGGGFVPAGPGEYTFTGTREDAQLALQALSFNPTDALVSFGSTSTTSFTVSVTDGVQTDSVTETSVFATPAFATPFNDTITLPFEISSGGLVDMLGGIDHLTLSSVGNNILTVRNSETITGGSQDDTVTLPSAQTLTVDLMGGFNTLNIASGTTTLTAENIDAINGTGATETLRFQTPVSDVAINLGSGGTDRVFISAGVNSFSLTGVEQLRALNSGSQNVTLLNPVTGLYVNLGNGNDTLTIAEGNSTLQITNNVELIKGTAGNESLTLTATLSGKTIDLGLGADTLQIANGTTKIEALGIETLHGTASNNRIQFLNTVTDMEIDLGAGSSDRVYAFKGASSFSLTGVELLRAQGGGDQMVTLLNNVTNLDANLGNGNDVLNLAAGANSLRLSNKVETVSGTNQDDTLTLNVGVSNPTINLGSGNDTLHIANGTTRIEALGIESVLGSSGNNTFQLLNTVSGMNIDLEGGNDTLRLAGGGPNTLTVDRTEKIIGANGDDHITLENVLGGSDSVDLNAGDDTLQLASLDHTLTLSGVRDTETIKTGVDADYDLTLINSNVGNGKTMTIDGTSLGTGHTLSVNGAAETNGFLNLLGGAGDDTLIAGNKNDFLKGGAGANTLTGNGGKDTFDYDLLDTSSDILTDFQQGAGGDVLNIADLLDTSTTYAGGLGGPLASYVQFVDDGADSLVQIDTDGASLSASWTTIAIMTGGAGANLTNMVTDNNLETVVI